MKVPFWASLVRRVPIEGPLGRQSSLPHVSLSRLTVRLESLTYIRRQDGQEYPSYKWSIGSAQ